MLMLKLGFVIFGSGLTVALAQPGSLIPFVHRAALYSLSASVALLIGCTPT